MQLLNLCISSFFKQFNADDIAIVGPSAKAVNKLLTVCDSFAERHDILFSTSKSFCMCVQSLGMNFVVLSGQILEYVKSFTYLGRNITDDFNDNADIMREVKSLYYKGNLLIRKFNMCPLKLNVRYLKHIVSHCTQVLFGVITTIISFID